MQTGIRNQHIGEQTKQKMTSNGTQRKLAKHRASSTCRAAVAFPRVLLPRGAMWRSNLSWATSSSFWQQTNLCLKG
jgi:hypothetical protein